MFQCSQGYSHAPNLSAWVLGSSPHCSTETLSTDGRMFGTGGEEKKGEPHLVGKAVKEHRREGGVGKGVEELGVAEGRQVGRALDRHRSIARGRRGRLPERRKGRQKRARQFAKVLPQRC